MLLRLTRGTFRQIYGPATKSSYIFQRSVGKNTPVEVDDKDAELLLSTKTGGCCNVHYVEFERVDNSA